MITVTGRLRAWGNSIGVVLPKDELREERLGIDDEVEIMITKKSMPLGEIYGALKSFKATTKKSNDELLREIDKEMKSKFD